MNTRIRWITDEEGDIGLCFFGIITLIKYKEGIIVRWFGSFRNASRFQGWEKPCKSSS